jgi:hypothetical protein
MYHYRCVQWNTYIHKKYIHTYIYTHTHIWVIKTLNFTYTKWHRWKQRSLKVKGINAVVRVPGLNLISAVYEPKGLRQIFNSFHFSLIYKWKLKSIYPMELFWGAHKEIYFKLLSELKTLGMKISYIIIWHISFRFKN